MRMKTRKNLLLSRQAVARGERLAAAKNTSLSAVVEKQLLNASDGSERVDYWDKPTKPINRPGDPRFEHLRTKHG
jgi:hypothetical protein